MSKKEPVKEYIPLLPAAAKRLADQHHKEIVLVVSYDRVNSRSEITNYGQSAEDKLVVAAIADAVDELLAFSSRFEKTIHADFRLVEQAKMKEAIDRLTDQLQRAIELLSSQSDASSDMFAQQAMKEFRAAIDFAAAACVLSPPEPASKPCESRPRKKSRKN